MIIDRPYWAVFDATDEDFEASNETKNIVEDETLAQKDTLGIRYWLSKKVGQDAYVYKGKGNYTGGPITDIPAVYMNANDLAVLGASWRYTPLPFSVAKTITDFSDSENAFKDCFLYLLENSMLQNSATPADIAAAHVSLATTLTALNCLDFDNCYLLLKDAVTTTSFTQATKDNMIGEIENYLKKYPR